MSPAEASELVVQERAAEKARVWQAARRRAEEQARARIQAIKQKAVTPPRIEATALRRAAEATRERSRLARMRAEQKEKERVEQEARVQAERQARLQAKREARRLARAEREAREHAEQAARVQARAEQEAREHAERVVRERAQAERDIQERAEREARERAEQEARERAEAAAREFAKQERERAEEVARERQLALEEQERARLETQARHDAEKTVQRVVMGSTVTFGAGLDIRGFTTGFESCIVHVRGLPSDALEREIYELFTQQGIDAARLQLLSNEELPDGTREVKMAMDAESGHALSVGLDELEFRDSRLSFEVGPYTTPGFMDAAEIDDANVLTVSWQTATVSWVLAYGSASDAQQSIQCIHGHTRFGHRLEASLTAKPASPLSISPGSVYVKVDNIPYSTSLYEIKTLAGPTALWVDPLSADATTDPVFSFERVRDAIHASGGFNRDVDFLGESEIAIDTHTDLVEVRVQFGTSCEVVFVQHYLNDHGLDDDTPCNATLASSFSYTITISSRQYDAQRTQWVGLWRQARDTDDVWCSLTHNNMHDRAQVRIQITGWDKKAVGAFKLRVETLAAGEAFLGWHHTFDRHRRPKQNTFADRVLAESGALVCMYRRERQIKLYGSPSAVAQARTMIAYELARLASLDHSTHIPPASIQFFLKRGLPELHELLGAEHARFNPATRTLVTSGGDEVQHIVSRILEEAAVAKTVLPIANEDACPICFETASVPIKLSCGHVYCLNCLRHFIASAADSDRFPLVCMGSGGQCDVPIAIPTIERFLPRHSFVHLLEIIFRSYIARHPTELQYCRTPDCQQIYRAVSSESSRPSPVECPACFSVLCPMCHDDGHAGMSCKEHRAHNNPAEQERLVDEWIASQGGHVKRCPQCRVPAEKTAGCHHMQCRCGSHFCWYCLGVFAQDEIYEHMNAAHGGIYAAEPVVDADILGEEIDYAEQVELLRQAAARRVA